MRYRVAVDVGGTFTDVVCADSQGRVTFVKAPSTPHDQSLGVMDGLERLSATLGVSLSQLLANTERLVHGMTVATNALLERNGAKVGLLTTAGHRDVLEMREGLKPERYNLRLARAEPLIPRHLRIGVTERLRADGSVHTALDETSVHQAIEHLMKNGVKAIAVAYLHSYTDGSHERRTRELIQTVAPDMYVSLSSEVLPRIKEYQRVSTTAINAYVGPLIKGYLNGLQQRLTDAGLKGPLLIMMSHGGIGPVDEAVRVAAATALSGPAGGLAGARRIAESFETKNLVTLDMGGTSTDISLVVDGEVQLSTERTIDIEAIALPSLDIVTLGAGGGSIGRTDSGGLLEVGPQSAGAVPGPAAYGRGGTKATVTDASVVQGLLNPDNFLGGQTELDLDGANRVIATLGNLLNVTDIEAARGIHRVVNTHMAEGIRLATVRRGVDPRGFTLMGFGGAAGLHVTALARQLNIKRVLVPRVASVLSAWGMLATELKFEQSRSFVGETHTLDRAKVQSELNALAAEVKSTMTAWTDSEMTLHYRADMRYGEQVHEIDVDINHIDWSADGALEKLKHTFEMRHTELYTYALTEQSPVLVNLRVGATGALPPLSVDNGEGELMESAKPGSRRVYLDDWTEVPVYNFDLLATGKTIDGPAVVESDTTTVILRTGDQATVTPQQWLDIRIE